MPTLVFETMIAAPLDEVWAFHQDPREALRVLTPPDVEVRIESVEPLPPQVGTRVMIKARVPIRGEVTWVARYAEFAPPHPVVFGEEARFVDEQECGPFAAWRHEHEFERVDERTTRLIDRVTYRAPLGPVGWLADRLVIRRKLNQMFRYRHEATRRALEGAAAAPAQPSPPGLDPAARPAGRNTA